MAVGVRVNTFQDASRRITVSVFTHQGSPEREVFLQETVDVGDPAMVAVGGGAMASDGFLNTTSSPGGPGALLTASFPTGDFSGWTVESRDQESPQTYSLSSYVIGMKIAGMTRAQLIQALDVQQNSSSTGNHVEQSVGVDSGHFVLLGGGFQVDENRANLATASFPSGPSTWTARSQDHHVASPASIRVFAIGLKRKLTVGTVTAHVFVSHGGQAPHPSAIASVGHGFVLTGGGAEVPQVNNGNLLWKLQPSISTDPSFTAASKDHLSSAPCPINVFAIGIHL